jgi:hypothetical protein
LQVFDLQVFDLQVFDLQIFDLQIFGYRSGLQVWVADWCRSLAAE